MKLYLSIFAIILSFPFSNSATGMEEPKEGAEDFSTLTPGTATGIKEVEPGFLYTATYKTKSGTLLYFAAEKLDTREDAFWPRYRLETYWRVTTKQGLMEFDKCEKGIQDDQRQIEWFKHNLDFKEQIHQFYKDEDTLKLYLSDEICRIGSGVLGMKFGMWENTEDHYVYVAYASRIPITKRHPDVVGEINTIDEYEKHFGHIIISVAAHTKSFAPLLNVIGIFKSPFSVLRKSPDEAGLSMILQGFTAYAYLCMFPEKAHQFEDRQYMLSWPVRVMGNIFQRSVPAHALHILVDSRDNCMTGNRPDASGHLNEIKIDGVVIFKSPNVFGFSFPSDGPQILVDLPELAKFWPIVDASNRCLQ